MSSTTPVEQISYTTGYQQPTNGHQQQQQRNQRDRPKTKRVTFRTLSAVPNLNWPTLDQIPLHLHKAGRLYVIMRRLYKPGQCWGCGGDHHLQDCNPEVLKSIAVCNGAQPPKCKVRHVGKQCPFVGPDRWLGSNGNVYSSPTHFWLKTI